MITKERIDELISQRAKIYGISKQGNVFCLGLKFKPHTLNNQKWLENKYKVYSEFFETKEEAEWHKEFGCIERTERLELPTWEEIQKYERFSFKDKNCNIYTLHYISGFKSLAITGLANEFYAEATKENYTLACRKAKELFLGEKK